MDLSEIEIVFEKILNEDLELNNNNVSLLQRFISYWVDTFPTETIQPAMSNWFKKVYELQKQNKMNDGTCIVAIFILEALHQNSELSADPIFINSIFTRYLIPLHEIIVPRCFTNSADLTSSNDAVIAFFRLHCQLSRSSSGVQLLTKFNLWKQLFHFYLKSDKFHLFIQTSCSEYICNLISSELPNDWGVLLEVIIIITHHIKSVIQDDNLCDRALFRSLRFLYLIFSKYLAHTDANLLCLISKKCHSLENHLRQIATMCDDPITVRYSLKIYILFKCYLDLEGANKDDDIFKCFIASVHTLINENDKFESYVPEIFDMSCGSADCQTQLQNCASFLQIMTILIYLKQLSVNVIQESTRISLVPPIRDEFREFFLLYEKKLQNERQIPSMVNCILKNIGSTGECVNLNTRVYIISSLNSTLQSYEISTKKFPIEVRDVMINVTYALSNAISKAPETSHPDVQTSAQEVLNTSINVAQNLRHEVIIRLSSFSLCRMVLQKIKRISNENVELLRHSIIRGLDDPSWEIRDSVLELLNDTLTDSFIVGESGPVIGDKVVCDTLVAALKDKESFVRASAYSVLVTSVTSCNKHLWEKFLDYEKLLSETVQHFQNETENNVRQRMIILIHHVWSSYEISNPSLLVDIYKTVYQASTNDLHSEVRRTGMLFWHGLIQEIPDDEKNKRNIINIFENLSSVGCLQAVMDGIEDEYDFEVMITALNILRSLRSFSLHPDDFHETGSGGTLHLSDDSTLVRTSWLEKRLPRQLLTPDTKSAFIDAKTFVAHYGTTDIDQLIDDKRIDNENSFNLKSLFECFADTSCVDSAINQKDCY